MARTRQTELEQDPIVEALVPDPAAGPPQTVVLRGHLGRSTSAREWRLYLTPALDHYVVIPEDEILHTCRLPDEQTTLVWVPRDLSLQQTRVVPKNVATEFLQGAIVGDHLAAAELAPYASMTGPQVVRGSLPATITPAGPCHTWMTCGGGGGGTLR
ncbi:hypothetical protein ACIBJE_07100 [Micromonospora sp. NPDC050187]|uniref:hypothetical protein n=1 Tax=Micromonospora sp. NPDC050187 TaxID=3364277 RepID=UPI00378AC53D